MSAEVNLRTGHRPLRTRPVKNVNSIKNKQLAQVILRAASFLPKIMIIRPIEDFQLLGMGYNPPKLDKTRTYTARPATNEPDWQEMGKVFVSFDNDDEEPSILLEKGDYVIIEP